MVRLMSGQQLGLAGVVQVGSGGGEGAHVMLDRVNGASSMSVLCLLFNIFSQSLGGRMFDLKFQLTSLPAIQPQISV